MNEELTKFYKELKGYKVNITTRQGLESFIGLIARVIGDTWIELVPFAPDSIKARFEKNKPDMIIDPIPTTVFKRLSTIDTIIVLDKPDEYYERNNAENKESK